MPAQKARHVGSELAVPFPSYKPQYLGAKEQLSFGKCVCVCVLKKICIEHFDAILARRSLSFHLNLPLSTASIASQLFDNQQPLIGRPVAL